MMGILKKVWNKTVFADKMQKKKEEKQLRDEIRAEVLAEVKDDIIKDVKQKMKDKIIKEESERILGSDKGVMERMSDKMNKQGGKFLDMMGGSNLGSSDKLDRMLGKTTQQPGVKQTATESPQSWSSDKISRMIGTKKDVKLNEEVKFDINKGLQRKKGGLI